MTDERNFRRTSEAPNFPWAANDTPLIHVADDATITWAQRKAEKAALLGHEHGTILGVWPGQWRTDVFLVDNRGEARKKLLDMTYR